MEKMMNFLEKLSTATKAVLATAVIGLPEFPTIVNAAIAWSGIGEMPPDADLQRALAQVLMALISGLLVYQMPNATAEEVIEKKEESNDPTPQTPKQVEAEDEAVNTIEENPTE